VLESVHFQYVIYLILSPAGLRSKMAPVTHIKKDRILQPGDTGSVGNRKLSRHDVPEGGDDTDLIYDRLIREAPYISSDEVEFQSITSSDIPWIDFNLVKAGQAFVARNFFSLICAHLGALLYGFSFKSLSTLLLRTGNSNNVEVSLIRYLSTFMHLKTWYESNIVDGSANGYADIQRVKKMHLLALRQYRKSPLEPSELKKMEEAALNSETSVILEAVRKDLEPIPTPDVPHHLITYYPAVPMSQYDLSMTQFGIISLVYLFPGVLGIRDCRGLDGFMHLWGIIGKFLGIHDKFNLALYPSDRLYRKIFTNIGIGSLKESDLTVISLQEVLIQGVATYAHFTTHKSLLYFGLSRNDALVNYKGTELRKLLTWKDYIFYWLMRILLGSVYAFTPVRIVVNSIARRALARASRQYLSRRKLKVPDPVKFNWILKFKKRCEEVKRHLLARVGYNPGGHLILGITIASSLVLVISLIIQM